MGCFLYDEKLHNNDLKKEWAVISSDFDTYFYENYTTNTQGILSRFRQYFHVTPITLKTGDHPLKPLAVYLLSRYTHQTEECICKEFHLTSDEIKKIVSQDDYEDRYAKELKEFFEEQKRCFFANLYTHFLFMDTVLYAEILSHKDKNGQK